MVGRDRERETYISLEGNSTSKAVRHHRERIKDLFFFHFDCLIRRRKVLRRCGIERTREGGAVVGRGGGR